MGRSAAQVTESGRTRFLALLMATVVAALSTAAFAISNTTFGGRETRAKSRNPVLAGRGQEPKALWNRYWESEQGRQFSVVVVWPLTADAPLPPGLDYWPAPGEAFLSPALADGPAREDFARRYGHAVGQIGEDGLATPGERLVYTRPSEAMLNSSHLEGITAFGSPGPSFGDVRLIGEGRDQQLAIIMALLLALPAAGLAVAAARMGAHGYDRRARLLHLMGANRRARAWMNLGGAALPITLGALTAALLLTPALIWNVTLPWIDFTLAAADLRKAASHLLVAVLGSALAVLAITLLLQPSPSPATKARRGQGDSGGILSRMASAACCVFLTAALLAGWLAPQAPIYYQVAVIGVLATLPSVIGRLTARLAPRLALSAHKSGAPGRLIAARALAARPGTVVRLVSTLVIAVGVIGQTQLITSMLYNRSGDTALLHSAEGKSMALIQAADRARPSEEFRAVLPKGLQVVSLGHTDLQPDGSSGGRIIQAPCADLTALALPCPEAGSSEEVPFGRLDRRLKATTYTYFGDTSATVRTGPTQKLDPQDMYLVVFDPQGQALDIPAVKRAARLTLSTDAVIRPLAEGSQSYTLGYQARWLPFLGAVGTTFLTLAMVFSTLSEFLRFARNLAPLTAVTGEYGVFRATAGWALALPMALAGVAGVATYIVLALPVIGGPKNAELSGELCAAILTLTAALSLATTLAAQRTAMREAQAWRPRADSLLWSGETSLAAEEDLDWVVAVASTIVRAHQHAATVQESAQRSTGTVQSGGEAHPKVNRLEEAPPADGGIVTAGRYERALTTCHPYEGAACHPHGIVTPSG
ncbi:hypothetical protein HET69_39745 [Streptomyces sp. CJ_13]|uniref:hypothetical protein n=2 Tax=Streptomyces TaxID=1883 RepID=UPI001BDD443C|nr:hypothetical protein [Streptomyces sp. CJ_13]MBT1189951.1 hypothetical protein [Streptomyces sp. CJ_13]